MRKASRYFPTQKTRSPIEISFKPYWINRNRSHKINRVTSKIRRTTHLRTTITLRVIIRNNLNPRIQRAQIKSPEKKLIATQPTRRHKSRRRISASRTPPSQTRRKQIRKHWTQPLKSKWLNLMRLWKNNRPWNNGYGASRTIRAACCDASFGIKPCNV